MNVLDSAAFRAASSRASRFDIVDMARGLALIGMFVFHLGWDVTFLGLTDYDLPEDWRWRWLARLVAGSFLFITGTSLVLAARDGVNWPAFWRRFGLLAGAAALVSAGTWLMVPEAFVKFGILHHIALASLAGVLVLRWPLAVVIGLAVLAALLPLLVPEGSVAAPLLDHPLLSFLGLGRGAQDAVDFVPVFPWLALVLAGIVFARVALARRLLPSWPASGRVSRLLAFGGRHSLAVYLIHQPVFIGLLMGLSFVLDRTAPPPETAHFTRACESACVSTGLERADCVISCTCSINRIKAENLWEKTVTARLTAAEQARIQEIAKICLKTE